MTARVVSGPRVLEPAELDRQIERVSAALAKDGIRPGDAVALLLRNDFAFFAAALAARRLGAFATPINWHATPDEIGYVLSDSGAKVLVGHDDLLTPLKAVGLETRVVAVPTPAEIAQAYGLSSSAPPIEASPWSDWLAAADGPAPAQHPAAGSVMIYTSGTTGKPKGVRRQPMTAEHGAAQGRILAEAYGLAPGGRMAVLMTGPMYHSAPNSYGLAAAGLAETIVLQPRFDAEDLLATVQRHGITHMHMVPTMFVRLLKLPQEVKQAYDLSSLRFVTHGAAPCPIEVKRGMIDWWGPVIHEYYGSTETGLMVAHGSREALAKPGTVGRALPGVDVRILDDGGTEMPAGGIGDVFVNTRAMSDFTYHGREAERDAIGRAGLVTVGDIGWLDADGYLFLCDRRKDMIISGGVNIYPAEIEAELLAVEGVRDCAVFGIPDTEFGEAVCAWVEPEPGRALDAAEIRAALAAKLSRYKLPKIIEFASALPREDTGKIFKRRLRDPYWQGSNRLI